MVAMAEETGIDGGGRDQRREQRRGDHVAGTLEFFLDESQMTRDVLLFIGLKISEPVLKLEP
jgi:hypothetical protein